MAVSLSWCESEAWLDAGELANSGLPIDQRAIERPTVTGNSQVWKFLTSKRCRNEMRWSNRSSRPSLTVRGLLHKHPTLNELQRQNHHRYGRGPQNRPIDSTNLVHVAKTC